MQIGQLKRYVKDDNKLQVWTQPDQNAKFSQDTKILNPLGT